MTSTPNFVATPKMYRGRASVANTARDGTGTIVEIVPASSGPARKIERIEITAEANSTAQIIRLYLWNGTEWRIWREVQTTAITPSATVLAFSTKIDLSSASETTVLEAAHKIGFAPHNGEVYIAHAFGGEF